MDILIVGGGIGGLTAAMMLSGRGHQVRVYEAVAEIKALGVGINLLPHAAKVLDTLGLTERLVARGIATAELIYCNRHGQQIWNEPRGVAAGYAWPQVSIDRGQLHLLLLEAARQKLGPGAIVTDRRLQSFEQNGRVSAVFVTEGGKLHTTTADVLVAADGIHSTVRRHFYPDEGPPCYSGRMLWRATSQAQPYLTGASMIMAGHQNQKFVCYPISKPGKDGRTTINWIAELCRSKLPRREDWNRIGDPEDFLPRFADWNFGWLDVPALIRSADNIYEFPMVDRDPLPRWSFGAITLLGDAAHPMYPIGSNGASQAILDSVVLADVLDEQQDPVIAFKAYEKKRLEKTASIVLANRGNGPEHCMQLAEERAPDGFNHIEDVISRAELEAIAQRYKQLAGFDKQSLSVPR